MAGQETDVTVQRPAFSQNRPEAQLRTRHSRQPRQLLSCRTRRSSAAAGVPVGLRNVVIENSQLPLKHRTVDRDARLSVAGSCMGTYLLS